MIRRIRETATIFFLALGFSFAAVHGSAVDGRWQGAVMTPNGPVTIAYNFKVNGQVLTSTVKHQRVRSQSPREK